jgi:WD40 repeat protein
MAAMAEEKWDRVRFTVTVFDVATWQNRRLAGHTDLVTGLAFSPDNKTLVTCSQDNTLRVWDVETGKQARKIEAKDCWNIAFAPDGKSVACTGGPAYLVRIFDVQTGKLLRELPGTERAGDVVYSPDGKILATSNHWDSVVFWDPETGKEIRRLPAPTRNFSSPDYFDLSLAFSQDGKSFAAATRSAILRWDVATGKEIDPPAGHDGPAGGLRFSEDGRSLFSSSGGGNGGGYTLMEWDLASHREKKRLTVGPFGDSTTNWVGAPDSHTLDNRYVAVIGSFRRGLPGYQPDSKFYLYDAATAKKIKTFVGHPDQVWGSRLSPRGTALLTFAKDGVRLWNVPTGKQVRHWDRNAEPQAFSYAYAFSPDEKWLAWQWGDNRVHLLATADAKEIRSWENEIPERENSWLFFSPDGTLLASLRSNHVFRVWDVASARQVAQFGEPNQSFNYPHAFSPDGRYVVEAQAKPPLQSGFMGPRTTFAISLWEVLSGQKVRTIDMGPFWPIDLAVSPDSRVLGVGGMDSTILLLDITAESKNAKRDVPNRKELDALWVDLGDDATKAYAAIWSFELAPDSSVRYLKDRLKPAAPADQAGKLVADLDSDRFALREKAAKTLEDLGDAAEGALHKRLQAKPSLETQRRLESIIEKLDKSLFQKLRAIAALEYIGNAQAKEVLQSLRTAPNPRVAEAAAVSLQRMASRPVR